MLKTPEERVRLLRAGISGRTIERLYIMYNKIKIVHNTLPFVPVEISIGDERDPVVYEITAETEAVYVQEAE